MSIESYMQSREEFSGLAQRLKDGRATIKRVSEALHWDPFAFSFTKNGNLLVGHPVQKNHLGFSESEQWLSVDEITEIVNQLHSKKDEMISLYKQLPEGMQKVVQSPNDLLKEIRESGRR